MALKPHDPSVVEADQKALKEGLSGSAVPGVNLEAITTLNGLSKTFEFPLGSKKLYDVPLVPYHEGLQLSELYLRMVEYSKKYDVTAGVPAIYEKMLDDILSICWSLIVPRSKMQRLLKQIGLTSNPMMKMSEAEIGEVLGFFLARRIVSNVQFHSPATQSQSSRSRPTS